MGWNVLGAILAGMMALFAYSRSRRPGGYYDADIYGLTPQTHARYAALSALFFAGFCSTIASRAGTIALYLLAAFVLFAVFYLTSFLRGAHEDED